MKTTYTRMFEAWTVSHLHPMPGLGVPAGLLQQSREQFRLKLWDVKAELNCILCQNNVVVNSWWVQHHWHEQLDRLQNSTIFIKILFFVGSLYHYCKNFVCNKWQEICYMDETFFNLKTPSLWFQKMDFTNKMSIFALLFWPL